MSGERSGLIVENSYRMGETLNGVSGLDVNIEKQVVEDQLHLLRLQGASEKDITIAMKDLGIQRSLHFHFFFQFYISINQYVYVLDSN